MQETRTEAVTGEVSAAGGTGIVTGSASASMGNASSSGVVTFHSSAGKSEDEAEDSRAMFQTYVRASGKDKSVEIITTWLM